MRSRRMEELYKDITMYFRPGLDTLSLFIVRWTMRRKLPKEVLNEEIASIMYRILLICNSLDPGIFEKLQRKLMIERYYMKIVRAKRGFPD